MHLFFYNFSFIYDHSRFLQQWLVTWNGYDGNIYITTAETLPNFKPPKIFIAKDTSEQKNWYPCLIHKYLGLVTKSQSFSLIIALYLFDCRRQGR